MNKKFELFSFCIPVKGAKKSVICDLRQGRFIPISNTIYSILDDNVEKKYSIIDIKRNLDNRSDYEIDTLLNFLEQNKMGIYQDENSVLIKKINFQFYSHQKISNSIIEIKEINNYNIIYVLNQLNKLFCEAIEIRFLEEISKTELINILEFCKEKNFKIVNLFIKNNKNLKDKDYKDFFYKYRMLNRIFVHSTSDKNNFNSSDYVFYLSSQLKESHRECVSLDNLVLNYFSFSEAKNFNLGLNKKLSIDYKGNVKNHLSHSKIFGNVNNESLSTIIKKDSFKTKWNLSHDKIEICRECQYRYMCNDCIDITQNKQGKFIKTMKCNFDPYRDRWT